MKTNCADVDQAVRRIRLEDPAGVLPVIAAMPGVEHCLTVGMNQAADARDWLTFGRYVIAASRRPDASMTDVLCRVLLQRVPEVNNDDVVDLLGVIRDPAAVPALADALIWEPDWDEFRHISRKATWSLGQTGTEEARLLLQGAAETADEWVREAAAYELGRFQRRPR